MFYSGIDPHKRSLVIYAHSMTMEQPFPSSKCCETSPSGFVQEHKNMATRTAKVLVQASLVSLSVDKACPCEFIVVALRRIV